MLGDPCKNGCGRRTDNPGGICRVCESEYSKPDFTPLKKLEQIEH